MIYLSGKQTPSINNITEKKVKQPKKLTKREAAIYALKHFETIQDEYEYLGITSSNLHDEEDIDEIVFSATCEGLLQWLDEDVYLVSTKEYYQKYQRDIEESLRVRPNPELESWEL